MSTKISDMIEILGYACSILTCYKRDQNPKVSNIITRLENVIGTRFHGDTVFHVNLF